MSEHNQKSCGYIRGLVTGVLIGAGAALLLAPKRGEDLREELAQNAAEWKDKAAAGSLADRAQEFKDRATELSQAVAQKAQEYKAKGQDVTDNASNAADDLTEHDAEESV
jgi:gas vesicle protein